MLSGTPASTTWRTSSGRTGDRAAPSRVRVGSCQPLDSNRAVASVSKRARDCHRAASACPGPRSRAAMAMVRAPSSKVRRSFSRSAAAWTAHPMSWEIGSIGNKSRHSAKGNSAKTAAQAVVNSPRPAMAGTCSVPHEIKTSGVTTRGDSSPDSPAAKARDSLRRRPDSAVGITTAILDRSGAPGPVACPRSHAVKAGSRGKVQSRKTRVGMAARMRGRAPACKSSCAKAHASAILRLRPRK